MATESAVLLELLVSCDGGRGPTQMHTHTHRKQEFDLCTVLLLRGQTWLFACGNKDVFRYFCDIFIRKANTVRNKQITSFINPNDLFPISHSIKCFLVLHHDWANPLSPRRKKRQHYKATMYSLFGRRKVQLQCSKHSLFTVLSSMHCFYTFSL